MRFKKLLKNKKIETAMKLSFYIFREFAYIDINHSNGKQIAQMLQLVYCTYIDIIKFDLR
jgi:hypothetical protein